MTAPSSSLKSYRLDGIEFCRGVAACMVVFYHISRHYHKNFGEYPFTSITEFGHAGVDFFFTLSGFIILYVHHNDIGKKEKYFPYLFKRLARVYPIYWFVILLHLALVPFIANSGFPTINGFLKNLVLWPQGFDGLIIGVSWTLQHEMVFYILFSVLILNQYLGGLLLILWFIFIIAVNYFLPPTTLPEIPVFFSAFNSQFLMGMLAALAVINWKISFPIFLLFFGLIGFTVTAFYELEGILNGFGRYARLFYGLSSTLIIIGYVAYEKKQGITMPWVGRILGRSSYSIYLTHLFFNGIIFKTFSILGVVAFLPYWGSAFIVTLTVIIAACITSTLVELPLTRLTRRLLLSK